MSNNYIDDPNVRVAGAKGQMLALLLLAVGAGGYYACKSQVVAPDAPNTPGNPDTKNTPPVTSGSAPAPVATVPCPENKGDVIEWPAGEEPDSYGDRPRGVCLAKPANGDCASITNACVLSNYGCGYVQHGDKVIGKAPTKDATACCWKVKGGCAVGRPFVVDGVVRLAELTSGSGWSEKGTDASFARVTVPAGFGAEPRVGAALADVWARDGLAEHASVASFAQLVLELLALGAPIELVSGAQKAMADEIEHARRAFGLASAYAGAPVAPGPLPTHGAMNLAPNLADFAARAASEGCIAETIAALQLHASADAAEDPALAKLLRQTAEEETTHAVLAYQIVRWAIAKGGARVRESVRAVFADAAAHVGFGPCPDDGVDLRSHGVLSRKERHDLAVEALRDVIGPAGLALDASAAV